MDKVKILVVSNNPFSYTDNNGKTLVSFFKYYDNTSIAQLYFSDEKAECDKFTNFFKISDNDILKKLVNFKKNKEINKYKFKKSRYNTPKILQKSDVARLIRELVWKNAQWNSKELNNWIENFNPNIIFFCAGDSVFAYRIVEYIMKKWKCKLVVYVTDDYILNRLNFNIFWWIRKNIVFKKMKRTIKKADLFITISDKMRETYKKIFKKESLIAANMTFMENKYITCKSDHENILVYAGGLNFDRDKTLYMLAKTLKKFNSSHPCEKYFLHIYTKNIKNIDIIKNIEKTGTGVYCGFLNQKNLFNVMNNSSALVYVESFKRSCRDATKLSLSTKIPEYLSLKKPILAIGPSDIGSMEYLSDAAYCITECKSIEAQTFDFLLHFIHDDSLIFRAKNKLESYKQNNVTPIKMKLLLDHLCSESK